MEKIQVCHVNHFLVRCIANSYMIAPSVPFCIIFSFYQYKFNFLRSKHVIFLIDEQLVRTLGDISLYTHMLEQLGVYCLKLSIRHRFSRQSSSLGFKKCSDSYKPRKRVFPKPISQGNLLWGRMF